MNDFEKLAREFLLSCMSIGDYMARLEDLIEKSDRETESMEASRREHLQLWTAENYNIGPCPKCESRKVSLRMVETRTSGKGSGHTYFAAEAECTTCWHRIEPMRVCDSGRMSQADIEALNIRWEIS